MSYLFCGSAVDRCCVRYSVRYYLVMPAITSENAKFWQELANELGAKAPMPGKRVQVVGGRKHAGKCGVVLRNIEDKFDRDTYRYGSEASDHLRDMARKRGYVVLVREDSGAEFWVKAKLVEVVQ